MPVNKSPCPLPSHTNYHSGYGRSHSMRMVKHSTPSPFSVASFPDIPPFFRHDSVPSTESSILPWGAQVQHPLNISHFHLVPKALVLLYLSLNLQIINTAMYMIVVIVDLLPRWGQPLPSWFCGNNHLPTSKRNSILIPWSHPPAFYFQPKILIYI